MLKARVIKGERDGKEIQRAKHEGTVGDALCGLSWSVMLSPCRWSGVALLPPPARAPSPPAAALVPLHLHLDYLCVSADLTRNIN